MKGTRVIVQGRLKQRTYETRDGEKRTVMELEVDEIGPSLRYATAKVMKVVRGPVRLVPTMEDPRAAELVGVGAAVDEVPPF